MKGRAAEALYKDTVVGKVAVLLIYEDACIGWGRMYIMSQE